MAQALTELEKWLDMPLADKQILLCEYSLDVLREILTSGVPAADPGSPNNRELHLERRLQADVAQAVVNAQLKIDDMKFRQKNQDVIGELLEEMKERLAAKKRL